MQSTINQHKLIVSQNNRTLRFMFSGDTYGATNTVELLHLVVAESDDRMLDSPQL